MGSVADALGVSLRVSASDPVVQALAEDAVLLPDWASAESRPVDLDIRLERKGEQGFLVFFNGEPVLSATSEVDLRDGLRRTVHLTIAERSPYLFLHAGVVIREGRAWMFPGRSGCGKSQLVYECLQRGAEYYSDEYAVVDPSTLHLLPFARPLSLRRPNPREMHLPAAAQSQAPLAAIALLAFDTEAPTEWRRLTPGEAALALFEHCVAAQAWGPRALETLARLCQQAPCWRGLRSEAAATVLRLVQLSPGS